MELFEKLKAARAQAGLTQEQAAEALLVSRQTVSNRETGKTYPDIVSVVKMSDLYGVSLDALLKEKEEVSDYVRYLDESCDRVRSGRRLRFCILAAVYFLVWAAAPVTYWCFTGATDAMGFSLLFFYLLFPLTHIALSAVLGADNSLGRGKWLFPLAFGAAEMLAYYVTFDAAWMSTTGVFTWPRFELFFFGVLLSLAGLALGTLLPSSNGAFPANKHGHGA